MPKPNVGADVTGEGETRDMEPADDAAAIAAETGPTAGSGDAELLTGDGGDEQFTVVLLY